MFCFDKYIDSQINDVCAVSGENHLSYRELRTKSKYCSNFLMNNCGANSKGFIGIMMDRNNELLIAMHSVWLAKSAFVVLDPELPEERLLYIIKDSSIKTIITEPRYLIKISRLSCQLGDSLRINPFVIEDFIKNSPNHNNYSEGVNNLNYNSTSAPAYVIYTSGTTGAPKGIVCSHAGLLNLCKTYVERHEINNLTRTLQFSNISFDASVAEIFPTLYGGGSLFFGSRDDTLPGEKLKDFIKNNKINYISLPPTILSTLNEFASELNSLKTIVSAGEPLLKNIALPWVNNKKHLFNAYGPSEVTVCATMHKVNKIDNNSYDTISIGKPINNVRIEIIEQQDEDLEFDNYGELLVSGAGVENNYYLNNPDLNKEKFVVLSKNEDCKYYKTGDKVSMDDQGNIYFLGRAKDDQVKIRGFRVQLEAIENTLCCFPGITTASAKIVSTDKEKSKYIAVYYCVSCEYKASDSDLQAFIKEKLPNYMVPNYYVQMESMPLTKNRGKIDKSALPLPKQLVKDKVVDHHNDEHYIDKKLINQSPVEVICKLFDKVLNKPLGTTKQEHDFFQSGGDSLKVAHLVAGIKRYLSYDILLAVVYENPTPEKLSCTLNKEDSEKESISVSKFVEDLSYQARLDGIKLPRNFVAHSCTDNAKNIFLTGGTGFLGVNLIQKLHENNSVDKIYCLIRSENQEHALQRLKDSFKKYKLDFNIDKLKKIICIAGDLDNFNFGIAQDEFDFLAKEIDIIIHSAADINYISSYSTVEKANVESVKNLLKFSINTRTKELHYISTLAVLGAGTLTRSQNIYEDFNLDVSASVLHFENAYTQSKWIGEKILQNASKMGIASNIYRPGFIQGNSQSGASNISDLFCRLLMGNIQAKIFPDYPFKYWLPVPVDYTADAISYIACSGQNLGKTYHLISNDELSHNEIFEYIDSIGYKMKKVSSDIWYKKLLSIDSKNMLFPLVNFLTQKVYYNEETILDVHHYTPKVHDCNTKNAIRLSNIIVPDFNETYIKKSIRFFDESGVL